MNENRNTSRSENGKFKEGEVEHRRRRDAVPIICGIYKITNPIGEIYVGGSRTIYRRWLRHKEARKKLKIHLSIKQYGWRSHTFEVVHNLPPDVSDDILLQYEQLYIDLYKECNCIMLNVKDAGSKAKFSNESRQRMYESHEKKKFEFMYNGEKIEFVGLKKFCKENGLSDRQMSALFNRNGFYGAKNYYKGYSRVSI
jgi:group I intron endonuclease